MKLTERKLREMVRGMLKEEESYNVKKYDKSFAKFKGNDIVAINALGYREIIAGEPEEKLQGIIINSEWTGHEFVYLVHFFKGDENYKGNEIEIPEEYLVKK